MSENHFDMHLEELADRAVGRLVNADVFDGQAFDALTEHLWEKADGLKHESAISKQVLGTIRTAASAIRTRAEYLPSVREQLHRADAFELMLDLLILVESRSDRVPGVPRIV